MKTKSKTLGLLAMMSVLGAGSEVSGSIVRGERLRKGNPEPTDAERNKMKGLKEFKFGENVVWAINEKNANKKAKKLGFIPQ